MAHILKEHLGRELEGRQDLPLPFNPVKDNSGWEKINISYFLFQEMSTHKIPSHTPCEVFTSDTHQEGVRSARMRFPGASTAEDVGSRRESTTVPFHLMCPLGAPPAPPPRSLQNYCGCSLSISWPRSERQLGCLGVSHLHLPPMNPLEDFGLIMAARLQ